MYKIDSFYKLLVIDYQYGRYICELYPKNRT